MVILIDVIILALGIAMRVAAVLLFINLIESVTENACFQHYTVKGKMPP